MNEKNPWEDGPRCPRCDGPGLAAGEVENGQDRGIVRCARCDHEWSVDALGLLAAYEAENAWKSCHVFLGLKSWRAWEKQREAEKKAKLARAMEGRW